MERIDSRALLKTHRSEILDVAARNGTLNVCVFGSVAGGNRLGSGLEFLVNEDPWFNAGGASQEFIKTVCPGKK